MNTLYFAVILKTACVASAPTLGITTYLGVPPLPPDLLESVGYGHTTIKIFEE
jgi:hypothetical protein